MLECISHPAAPSHELADREFNVERDNVKFARIGRKNLLSNATRELPATTFATGKGTAMGGLALHPGI
jgi:hypothetical protein